MLTILTGGPESRRMPALLDKLDQLAKAGRPGLLLVPESASHQAERALLTRCGNRAGAFVAVTTFHKLTDDVLEVCGLRPDTLDAGGRILTMHRALADCAPLLRYYHGAGRPQLTEKLVGLADELQSCSIAPERLMEAAGEAPKLRDLALIYARYCGLCREGALDPSARIDLARKHLRESGLMRGVTLLADGFEGFTAQNSAMLEEILLCADNVIVTLLFGQDKELYTEQRRTLERLRRMADRHGIPICETALPDEEPGEKSAGLFGLAEEIFDFSTEKKGESGGLGVYEMSDGAGECELAAAQVRQLALKGVRLREIAVVCGDLERYGPLLSAAFQKYEMPLFLSEKTDLLQKPAIAAALGALEALEDGLTYPAVIDWLRCGLCGLSRDEIDRLENYCALWRVKGGAWFASFESPTCGYDNPAADEPQRLADIEALRVKTAKLLLPLREELRKCATGSDYAAALIRHLDRIGLEEGLQERCKALNLSGWERESAETAQLYQILQTALEQFSAAMQGVSMDRREFFRLLKLMLRQYDISTIPPTLDSVLAVGFERFSAERVRHVLVVGCVEGAFPPDKAETGLLSEKERVYLESCGVELTQNALERAYQQQCALCRALAAATESLTFTVPRRAPDGQPCSPAYLLKRLCELRGLPVREGETLLARLRLTAPKPLYQEACAAAGDPDTAAARAALDYVMSFPAQKEKMESLRRYAASPRGPIASPELVKKLYHGHLNMTASRLDLIASCRFSYFMQYGLAAKPRKPAEFGSPQIGTFVHYVVENAVRELCEDETRIPRAVAANCVSRYLEQELPPMRRTARFLAVFERAGKMACDIVENVWEEILAGDFRPVCFELDFSRDGDLPPLEMQESGVKLSVKGKIDRVDGYLRGDTLYYKVVDYKTGSKEFRLSDILYGHNLQMFLYLLMLQKGDRAQVRKQLHAGAAEAIEPCGALYIPAKNPAVSAEAGDTPEKLRQAREAERRRIGLVLDDDELIEAMERGGTYRFLPIKRKNDGSFTKASKVASPEQIKLLLFKTEAMLRKIALDISSGEIEAEPIRTGDAGEEKGAVCRYCAFQDACQFDPSMKKDHYRVPISCSNERVFEILAEEAKGENAQ
ncbi:MAG: PD-(D/E)XK nuclease family protein [Clostridia bacterium]|nr:PD-(D/E)XK nuclease family protein [Clostridia bacterium]